MPAFAPKPLGARRVQLGPYQLLYELEVERRGIWYLARGEGGLAYDLLVPHRHRASARLDLAVPDENAERIEHVNVAEPGRYVIAGERRVYVTQHRPGESLGEFSGRLVRAGQPLSEGLVLELMARACTGLRAIHRHGAHGHLSPKVLRLSYEGELLIMHLGLAPQDAELDCELSDLQILGRRAPERLRGAVPSPASDVYELCTSFFEVICGRPAIEWSNLADTVDQVMRGDRPLARSIRPELSAETCEILAAGMAADPGQRPANIKVLYGRIAAALIDHERCDAPLLARYLREAVPDRHAARRLLQARWRGEAQQGECSGVEVQDPREPSLKCAHCGAACAGRAELENHLQGCMRRRWHIRNFGEPACGVARVRTPADLPAPSRSPSSPVRDRSFGSVPEPKGMAWLERILCTLAQRRPEHAEPGWTRRMQAAAARWQAAQALDEQTNHLCRRALEVGYRVLEAMANGRDADGSEDPAWAAIEAKWLDGIDAIVDCAALLERSLRYFEARAPAVDTPTPELAASPALQEQWRAVVRERAAIERVQVEHDESVAALKLRLEAMVLALERAGAQVLRAIGSEGAVQRRQWATIVTEIDVQAQSLIECRALLESRQAR